MRRLLFLGLLLLMAGCNQKEKMESVCTDFVKSVAVDPSSVKINSIKSLGGPLGKEEVLRHFESRYPDGLPGVIKKSLESKLQAIEEAKVTMVQVDYTESSGIGVARDRALCKYYEWNDKNAELVAVSIKGKAYDQDDLFYVFVKYERPSGLSSSYKVE